MLNLLLVVWVLIVWTIVLKGLRWDYSTLWKFVLVNLLVNVVILVDRLVNVVVLVHRMVLGKVPRFGELGWGRGVV